MANLCKKHKVKKLYLFGSATSENFTENSDIDFALNEIESYFERKERDFSQYQKCLLRV